MQYYLRTFRGYRRMPELPGSVGAGMRVGSLGYSAGGYIVVLISLYCGCFAFTLIQSLVNTVLPLFLDGYGADSKMIATAMGALPYLAAVAINPVISFRSDRLRSSRGRRIPFLWYSAPVIAVFIALAGWSGEALVWLAQYYPGVGAGNIPLAVCLFFSLGYLLVFMVPMAVIWYLFPDVVPSAHMARFFGIFQVVGSLAGIVAMKGLLPLTEEYLPWVFSGAGLFYWLTVWMMCRLVREGEYPPVPAGDSGRTLLECCRVYIKECYSIPFYYWFFWTMALNDVSLLCRGLFNTLYAQKQLGMPLAEFGTVMMWYGVVGLAISVPVGWLADRFHPLRVYGAGGILVILVNCIGFYWVQDSWSFGVITMGLAVVYAIQNVCTVPVFVAILPKELYGQFSSANAIFRGVVMIVGSVAGGFVIDRLGYQYIYAWDFIFTLLGFGCWIGLYLGWKRRGGPARYTAPVAH